MHSQWNVGHAWAAMHRQLVGTEMEKVSGVCRAGQEANRAAVAAQQQLPPKSPFASTDPGGIPIVRELPQTPVQSSLVCLQVHKADLTVTPTYHQAVLPAILRSSNPNEIV